MEFSVEHIGLAARDPATQKDWYVRTLGGHVVYESGTVPPAFFVRLPGGTLLEIYQAERSLSETSQNKVGGWRHIALTVKSIERAVEELTLKGIGFEEDIKPAGGGGRVLFFKDAEGNLLHLVERPEGSPFKAG